jgi:CBS domain-containing protein
MLIQHILDTKSHTGVLTISKKVTLKDAIEDLAAHRVGALVVSEDGSTVDGIISERDIIRVMGQRGISCLGETVAENMTADITSCVKSSTAEEALQWMTDGRFRHLPVVEDGLLVGLISIGDVVKARLTEIENEKSAMVDMIRGY